MSNRVVHCKREEYDVYIGRPGPWGNPFSHKPNSQAKWIVANVEEAIYGFRLWLEDGEDQEAKWILDHLHELRGKTLGCWCAPGPCHGEVLLELANA